MLKQYLLLQLIFLLQPFSYSQSGTSFYYDVNNFKCKKNIIKVDSPFNRVENLNEVPENKIHTVTEIENDTFFVTLISNKLKHANEPIYKGNTEISRSYRFVWLRSFKPDIIITLSQEGQFARIETKWLLREGIKTAFKQVPLSKLEEFESMLISSAFWNASQLFIREIYIDGSNWILEAKSSTNYHVFYEHSPLPNSMARKIGTWLIQNSDALNEQVD